MEIRVDEAIKYKYLPCPRCRLGKMREVVEHDAMSGNRKVLRCDKLNSCGLTIDIIASAFGEADDPA